MLFNSFAFMLFLPVVFAGYWLIYYPKKGDVVSSTRLWLQNLFVVVASYVFYGWWDWKFLLLISFTSLWAWASGLTIEAIVKRDIRTGLGGNGEPPRRTKEKAVVAGALVVNLGILGIFKYYNFFLGNAVALLNAIGFQPHPSSLKIILPVGISFYTFQALSYVIDVYRKDIKPTRDVVAFLAFVSFFPQLVAGPIERATNLLPQFLKPRHFDYALAVDGCRQMLWGFFKKMVVADGCAFAANTTLDAGTNSSFSLLVGLFCFAMQIYGDFSGYSDIAIGLSKTFGIKLKQNFAVPYFSRNVGEFWRRWHISLTTWFKDYLYIPLGGSRHGLAKTIRNTFIVFGISGLWHGANWTFIMWGFVHAIAFVPSLVLGTNRKFAKAPISKSRCFPMFRELLEMIGTFVIVMFGWAFFRAETIGQAWSWLYQILFGFDLSVTPILHNGALPAVFWSFVMLLSEWFNRDYEYGFCRYAYNRWVRYITYFVIFTIILLNVSPRQAFVYFQF